MQLEISGRSLLFLLRVVDEAVVLKIGCCARVLAAAPLVGPAA